MKAFEFLKSAEGHLVNRGVTYDSDGGERSMAKIVKCFNEIADHKLTVEQGWLFMTILKMVRSQQGKFKADSYEDGASYFALMGEEASKGKSRVKSVPK